MKNIFKKIVDEHQVILKEFNGEEDHIYMLIHYPPKVSLSKLVNSLKAVSSRRLRQNWPQLEEKYYKGVLWSQAILQLHAVVLLSKLSKNTSRIRILQNTKEYAPRLLSPT
jgi:REP element-mobilizing transposase RayT